MVRVSRFERQNNVLEWRHQPSDQEAVPVNYAEMTIADREILGAEQILTPVFARLNGPRATCPT